MKPFTFGRRKNSSYNLVIRNLRCLVLYFWASGIAALVNLGSRVLYNWWMNFGWAVVCAYFTGMLANFFLSSKYVFRGYDGGSFVKIFVKFAMVTTTGLFITWEVSECSLYFIQQLSWIAPAYAKLFAHATGIGLAFFISYFGHQFFTYRHTGIIQVIKRRYS